MTKKLFLTVAVIGTLTLVGCNSQKKYPSVPPLTGDIVADFSKGESEEVFGSDGWSNGQPFNAVWKKENVTYSDGLMHLSIKDEEATDNETVYPHTAGEARTKKLYGYGDFEVRMKPAKVVGTVSTFFTYTDEWNKVDGVENKHDEIDIEFLGKDTTKVQFNYFVGGEGSHEYMYNLGFDASKEFHNYGFRWEKDCITWLVDGKTAYQVKGTGVADIPSQSGRILASYWPSSAESWSGKYAGNNTATTDYQWIKASGETIYADGDEPQDPVDPDEDVKWDEITPTAVDFSTGRADVYTVTENQGVTNIAYERAGEWANVVGGGITEVANKSNAVNLTLKNNSSTKSVVRIDVQGTEKIGNTDCLNTSAAAKNHTEIYTDKEWGGSKIELAANEEVEFVVNYDVTTERGAAKYLLVFVDSLSDGLVEHAGGSLSISKVRFANTTGEEITPVTPVEPDPQPEEPDEPDATWDPIDVSDLTFSASDSNVYTVTKKDGVTNVKYTAAGNWANVSAEINTIANDKDTVRVTLKNNATVSTKVRVDVKGTNKVGNTDCLNESAVAEGHTDIYTDKEWGGSSLTLAAGEKAHFIITYDTHTEKGAATHLLVYMDSMQATSDAHAGDLDIRAVKFAKLGEDPVVIVDPDADDPVWGVIDAVDLAFNASNADMYNVEKKDGVTTVTYSTASGWANVSAELGTNAAGKDTVKVTLQNNSASASKIRVDVKGTNAVGNTDCLNVEATAAGHTDIYTDKEWGGSSLTLATSEKVDFVITYDESTEKGAATHLLVYLDSTQGEPLAHEGGSVSISNIKFAKLGEDSGEGGEGGEQVDESLALTFSGNSEYTLDPVDTATKSVNATYSAVGGSSYVNFGAGLWSEIVNGKTTLSVKVKNNGSEAAHVRVDVMGETQVGNTKDLATACSAQGHTECYTNAEWGGSNLTVAANEEVTFVVTFDQTTSKGAATYLMFFLDSARGDANTYGGNITLSNFVLA